MNATISYTLDEAGRKASLLAGGNGKEAQAVAVGQDDPLFPRVIELGTVQTDGNVTLTIYSFSKSFDRPQTAADIIAYLDAKKAKEEAEAAARSAECRELAEAVLRERRTRKVAASFHVNAEGSPVGEWGKITVGYEYEEAKWPGNKEDAEFRESPAAKAWGAELLAARQAKEAEILVLAREKLAELLAKEKADAERAEASKQLLAERKLAMGGDKSDYLVRIEDGAMANVPCWESHKRGKNWFATVLPNPRSPGGLDRTFAAKARGDLYYIVPALDVGMAIEFGADYYTGSGRKNSERWYGFVVAQNAEGLLLRKCDGGKEAHYAGIEFAKEKVAESK